MKKPVAWISRLPEGDVYNCAWAEKQNDDDIPLFTHPAKLTDEEIIKTMVQFEVYSSDDQCLIEAGRAILRKAQEK